MATKPKTVKKKVGKSNYNCLVCSEEKPEDKFYLIRWSPLWKASGGRCLFCRDCLENFMDNYVPRYGERVALKMMCHYLDLPFHDKAYQSIIEKNNTFKLGLYIRFMNLSQTTASSFINSLVDGEIASVSERPQSEQVVVEITDEDTQNRKYVISVCGYDPFSDTELSEADKKFCFNVLAGYCDSEGVSEDNHKIQSVIQLTLSLLQCHKIDECINNGLLIKTPDETKIKSLISAKTQLQGAIAKIAQDNNISSAYNQSSKKGSSTLSSKMKEIAEKGFENIYVNKFDIETCEAMKQIADISNRSILEELTLDANDYAEMIKEQRIKIVESDGKIDELMEENRKLQNRIIDLQAELEV